MSTDPDLKIVRQAKQGKRGAFNKLIYKYQDRVLALAYDYTGNYDEARDIAQNVFMRVFNKLDGFEEKARFSSWLYRIVVNQCLDELRKDERKRLSVERVKRNLNDLADEQAKLEKIDLYGADLSELQHTALILKYYQDLTIPEIAEIMECSESTVRTHLYRAVKKLRVYMEIPK